MSDLWTAIGLVLVIEGVVYALFPEGMKRMMAQLIGQPSSFIRFAGLAAALIGVVIVGLVRG
jgi:uncharacterized protein YjeT (DUF2065 family)